MIAYIESIGLQAPGLEDWDASQPVLQGKQPYQSEPLSKYSPGFLPANERRRTTDTIKLALRTAENTVKNYSQEEVSKLPTLFACVDGDTQVSAKMTTAILQEEPMISPIHFHNSVHNAPAGYWMIGQNNMHAASSISAGKYQLSNTLIEAMTLLDDTTPKVMVVLYDLPIDPVVETYQPEIALFGCGLVLTQQETSRSMAKIELTLVQQPSKRENDAWFGQNFAADFMPLLKALAANQTGKLLHPVSSALSAEITVAPRSL
ncbi:beta-ketoacyl synthase chain length factor [Hydrogenovibrio kuenenii]|uniref:beta-ketoacyl synthase chain length factor n=1 Tax=Hydrogenovibrio kuenenii TaxID=63658 RepID=UPI00046709FB|nr:beta-ketoacyl synthase chain length factor [Hydrogenovibrio kuenenii]